MKHAERLGRQKFLAKRLQFAVDALHHVIMRVARAVAVDHGVAPLDGLRFRVPVGEPEQTFAAVSQSLHRLKADFALGEVAETEVLCHQGNLENGMPRALARRRAIARLGKKCTPSRAWPVVLSMAK